MERIGLGVKINELEFNYCYQSAKYTGGTQNIGITIKLKNIAEPRANKLYEQGMDAYDLFQYDEAINYIEQAQELTPENNKIQEKIKEFRQKENENNPREQLIRTAEYWQ